MRRSAATNLVRDGIPKKVAMLFTGHKTRHMFEDYHRTDETDMLNAVKHLNALRPAQKSEAS